MQSNNSNNLAPAKRSRKTYTRAFKAKLVTLANRGEQSVSQIAIDHQINVNMLRKWIHKDQGVAPAQAMLPVSVIPESCSTTNSGCALEITLGTATLRFYHGWDPIAVAALLKAAK